VEEFGERGVRVVCWKILWGAVKIIVRGRM
jgi:hypothetical protein